jgi:hypothetical protein
LSFAHQGRGIPPFSTVVGGGGGGTSFAGIFPTMTSPFCSDETVDTPLAEPHGSALAFLSDLHEQVEMQINQCSDDSLRQILVDLRGRIEAAGLLVMTGGVKR